MKNLLIACILILPFWVKAQSDIYQIRIVECSERAGIYSSV